MLAVYQYSKCSTCRNALRWLDTHAVRYERIDIVTSPPTSAALRKVLELTGLPVARLFNTSGQSYRDGNYRERLKTLSLTQALAELAKDGKLIKRPLVVSENIALVGFDEQVYASRLEALLTTD